MTQQWINYYHFMKAGLSVLGCLFQKVVIPPTEIQAVSSKHPNKEKERKGSSKPQLWSHYLNDP